MAWRDQYHYQGYLWIHQPDIVYQGIAGAAAALGEIAIPIESDIQGTFANIANGMTVALGTSPGAWNLGRLRAHFTQNVTGTDYIGVYGPSHQHDGEGYAPLGSYVTVYDEYRVWLKPTYASSSGHYYFDFPLTASSTYDPVGIMYDQMPIANGGGAVADFVDEDTNIITVDFDAGDSFAVADDAVLGAYGSGILTPADTLTDINGNFSNESNATDGNTATYATGLADYDAATDYSGLAHDLGDGNDEVIRKFTITSDGNYGPSVFLFQWSDDDDHYITAYAGYEDTWGATETKTFYVHHVDAHRYWRWVFLETAGGGGSYALRIHEVQIYAEDRTSGSSPWTWDVIDGTITSGTSTSQSITATFPPGFRYVELEVTDTNGEVGVKHIPVLASRDPRFTWVGLEEISYSGASFSASSEHASYPADYAFDNLTTYWSTVFGTVTGWLKVQLATATVIDRYSIEAYLIAYAPKDWTFEGSNNDSDWTVLDTRTGETFTTYQEKFYACQTPTGTAYTYYRLNVTLNGGAATYLALRELNLLGPLSSAEVYQQAQVTQQTLEPAGQIMEFDLHEDFETYTGYEEINLQTITASADSVTGSQTADLAFDSNRSTYWGGNVADSGWLKAAFANNARTIDAYGLYCDATNFPVDWTLQGSNNDSDWTTLDTQTSQSWSSSEEQFFDLSAVASYSYYKIVITDCTASAKPRIYELNLYQTFQIPYYPDGAMVLYWENEYYDDVKGSLTAAGPTGREHMKFMGWIDEEPTSLEASEDGLLTNTRIHCLDTGQRLAQLGMFSIAAVKDAAPADGYEMKHANIDILIYLLVRWLSTGAEVSDFIWSNSADHYNFGLLAAQGSSLYDAIQQKARAIDHNFVCTKHNVLKVAPDLLTAADLFTLYASITEDLTGADYTRLDHTRQFTSMIQWVEGSGVWCYAMDADHGSFTANGVFTMAPDDVPGQGVDSSSEDEQVASFPLSTHYVNNGHVYPNSTTYNYDTDIHERNGRSYAQQASIVSAFDVEMVHAGDTGLSPLDGTWLTMTQSLSIAAQRQFTMQARKGVLARLQIDHDHEAMTKTVSGEWQRQENYVFLYGYTP